MGTFQALGDDHNPNGRAVIQMGGRLLRVDASVFRRELQRNPLLADAIEAYLRAMLIHISQSVACGAAHSVKERLARWLLQTSDRVASDDVRLTHEFLAHILHVRRASVTVALGELQDMGLVSTRRGGTRVLDRVGLAKQARVLRTGQRGVRPADPRRAADRVVSDSPMSEPERRRRHPVLPNAGQLDVPPETRPPVEGELRAEVKADRGKILLRLAFLAVTLIALYILWPSLLTVLETWPDLLTLDPLWFVAMLALEFASFVCISGTPTVVATHATLVRRRHRATGGQCLQSRRAGRCGRRRRAPVPHAHRSGRATNDGGNGAHRRIPHQHRHAVHAAVAGGAGRDRRSTHPQRPRPGGMAGRRRLRRGVLRGLAADHP